MIDEKKLKEILEKHKLWILGKNGGERADLSRADLSYADLSRADLSYADLSYANLSEADLSYADLSEADLSYADLRGADLRGANLSEAIGLVNIIDYLKSNFDKVDDGYIVYKAFGMYYSTPNTWQIKEGSIIEENVNSNRVDVCGCGINVATKEWIKKERPELTKAWKMLIKWEWLAGVVVPYNTDGKIRCERAMLLEEVEI